MVADSFQLLLVIATLVFARRFPLARRGWRWLRGARTAACEVVLLPPVGENVVCSTYHSADRTQS